MKQVSTTASDSQHHQIEVSYSGNNNDVRIRMDNGEVPGRLQHAWNGTLAELFLELELARAARDLFQHPHIADLAAAVSLDREARRELLDGPKKKRKGAVS